MTGQNSAHWSISLSGDVYRNGCHTLGVFISAVDVDGVITVDNAYGPPSAMSMALPLPAITGASQYERRDRHALRCCSRDPRVQALPTLGLVPSCMTFRVSPPDYMYLIACRTTVRIKRSGRSPLVLLRWVLCPTRGGKCLPRASILIPRWPQTLDHRPGRCPTDQRPDRDANAMRECRHQHWLG